MNGKEFLGYLDRNEVPPHAPEGAMILGKNYFWVDADVDMELWETRRKARETHMMFAIVTKSWTSILADWIGNRKCLEIMAGAGWLSLALSEFGVDIRATDDFSWSYHGKESSKYVFPVEAQNATRSILDYPDAEILLVSWPPYQGHQIEYACRAWGHRRPIVYIGEGIGGCTGTDYFYNNFREFRGGVPEIPLFCWPGIHDYVMIGEWVGPTTE